MRLPPLRQFRRWLLFTAAAMMAVLMAGLIHDFQLSDSSRGWFTPRPALPGVLLAVGFACMLGHSLASRERE